jgi:hypothetical protein
MSGCNSHGAKSRGGAHLSRIGRMVAKGLDYPPKLLGRVLYLPGVVAFQEAGDMSPSIFECTHSPDINLRSTTAPSGIAINSHRRLTG